MKHGWLYLNALDSFAALDKLIAFYVEQLNAVMPHSRFGGHTRDEMYFGTKSNLADELAERRRQARAARIANNRRQTCSDCPRAAGQQSSLAEEAS